MEHIALKALHIQGFVQGVCLAQVSLRTPISVYHAVHVAVVYMQTFQIQSKANAMIALLAMSVSATQTQKHQLIQSLIEVINVQQETIVLKQVTLKLHAL